jgi:hypothetical protein
MFYIKSTIRSEDLSCNSISIWSLDLWNSIWAWQSFARNPSIWSFSCNSTELVAWDNGDNLSCVCVWVCILPVHRFLPLPMRFPFRNCPKSMKIGPIQGLHHITSSSVPTEKQRNDFLVWSRSCARILTCKPCGIWPWLARHNQPLHIYIYIYMMGDGQLGLNTWTNPI